MRARPRTETKRRHSSPGQEIRIIGTARASSEETAGRLQQGLQALCDSLPQYSHFLAAVRPQTTGLTEPQPPSLSPSSLRSQPQLSRSISDPGTERSEQPQGEREAERPRAVTPSPGPTIQGSQGVQQLGKPLEEAEEDEEEDDAGCRVM